jgi:hypothetical protein
VADTERTWTLNRAQLIDALANIEAHPVLLRVRAAIVAEDMADAILRQLTPDGIPSLDPARQRSEGHHHLCTCALCGPVPAAGVAGLGADGDICTDPLGDSWRQLQEAERQIDAEEVRSRRAADGDAT